MERKKMKVLFISPTPDSFRNGSEQFPFGSISEAAEAVRTLCGDMTGDIVVYLRGGIYSIEETLKFDSGDSGSGGYRVIYRNYPGEEPVICGGKVLRGWVKAEGLGKDNVWKVKLPKGMNTRQLYVNGVRGERTRTRPVEVQSWNVHKDSDMEFYNHLETFEGWTTCQVYEGYKTSRKEMIHWKNQKDIEFVYDVGWTHSICPVDEIVPDGDGAIVRMRMPCFRDCQIKGGLQIGSPSYIENVFELLENPGEWYLDRSDDTLYYIPRPGEDMQTAEAIIPVVERLVEVAGTLDKPVSHIDFEGLKFMFSTFLRPGVEGHPNIQANLLKDPNEDKLDSSCFIKIPSAVLVDAAQDITFERCSFTRLGSGAMDIQHGAKGVTVRGCRFTDIAASGIQIGDFNHTDAHPSDEREIVEDIRIENNYFRDIGVDYKGSTAVIAGFVRKTEILHNEICEVAYSGISLGWGWGYWDLDADTRETYKAPSYYPRYDKPTIACKNRIEFNHIHHVMQKLHDGGAIYILSMQGGSTIRGNLIHDNAGYAGVGLKGGIMVTQDGQKFPDEYLEFIHAKGFPGGIYLDEGSGGFEITENMVYHVPTAYFYHSAGIKGRQESCSVQDNYFTLRPSDPGYPVEKAARAGLEEAYRDIAMLCD